MKNLNKITREQLKQIQGGVRPGMKKCIDETTCTLRIFWIGGGIDSPCTSTFPTCAPEGYEPPIDEPIQV